MLLLLLTALGGGSAWWCWSRGYTLYDGDAEAHLNIARRLLDSRTPGPEQIGTGWLPLPHILMAPFAMIDGWWKSGLAGAIPSAVYFVLAGLFLFLAARRALGSTAAGWTAALLFAANPNALYLGAAPMTEMLFAAGVAGMIAAALWFRDSQSLWAILAVGAASNTASLTRYEGWFLIPFVALFVLLVARRKGHAVAFAAVAALGPLVWLAHNQYYYSNALEFYNGPWSAMAVHQRELAQGVVVPTDHNWSAAAHYYFEAARLVAGTPLTLLGIAGAVVGLYRRAWALLLLLVCPAFYVWSLHSGGVDLYVPTLWPHTAYNTRYALPALMFAAFSASAVVRGLRERAAGIAVAVLTLGTALFWLTADPASICWREARDNSRARREAQTQTATYLAERYRTGAGIFMSLGSLSGVLRESGIPLRESLHEGNHPAWEAAMANPRLLLWQAWAIAIPGDQVSTAIAKAVAQGRIYRLKKQVIVEGTPVVEIYHLDSIEHPIP